MTDYTRLSVTGASRRAEIVVPSDEPLGAAVPALLDLLGEPTGTVSRPLALVVAGGEQLDLTRSAREIDLPDGTDARLVALDAAPPPPVVIDIADAAADARGARPDRWNDRTRLQVAASAIGVLAAAAGMLAPRTDAAAALAGTVIALIVALVVAVATGLGRMPRVAAYAVAAAAGLSVPLVADAFAFAGAHLAADSAPLFGLAALLLAASAVVAVGIGLGRRLRGAGAGGGLGMALSALLLVLVLTGASPVAASAITGSVAAVAIGLLPWLALSSAGLTGLDQRAADGRPVPRAAAGVAIDDAYRALTWSIAAAAAVLAITGATLALSGGPWSTLLAVAFALGAGLRTRSFPLRAHAVLLWGAVAIIALSILAAQLTGPRAWLGVAVCAAAIVLVAITSLVSPPAHIRARLRGVGNLLESLSVLALLPLLLGALGVYGDLLGMFGGDT